MYTGQHVKREQVRRALGDLFWGLVCPILLAVLLGRVIFIFGVVPTASMSPTVEPSSCYLGYRLADSSAFDRGDIILFETETGHVFFKRVVGLPGETISFDAQGQVFINDVVLDETGYLPSGTATMPGESSVYHIPEDAYFVMGDNRNNSADSRFWTEPYVKFDSVVGCVWVSGKVPILSDFFGLFC